MQFRLGLLAVLLLGPAVAEAQQPRPQKLGEFQSWTAASFAEGGQKTCYAFTRPTKSEGGRQGVMLTVTHRQAARDTVTISAGYAFPRNAEATVSIGGTEMAFYTSGTTAAARDGAAAVRAFRNGRDAVMKAPGANGKGTASDTFPLAGFGAAYDAISRECPAGGAKR
jgi:invasion protein IalB